MCQRDQDLAPMTIEDCCLNNPDGLSFQRIGIEICESCIGIDTENTVLSDDKCVVLYSSSIVLREQCML